MRFGALAATLMPTSTVKLEPGEPIRLDRDIDYDSWYTITEPYFLIEVTLSNGRAIRSPKLETPLKWRRRLFEAIEKANA